MLSAISLGEFSVSSGTGEKPQSKNWAYDEQWWTVMPNAGGTWIWRLDGTDWTPTLQLSSDSSVNADVKADGALAHILLYDGRHSQLASVQYDNSENEYTLWSARPDLVDIVLSGEVETATIDLDSTGRLWLASDTRDSVEVRHSDGNYSTWSDPFTLASGISTDDISAITALPDDSIGVLWSDQNTDRFGFRVHNDHDPADAWSVNEVPSSQSARKVGGGMADDHLNLAVASDGTVFAAVKTSYDSSSEAKIALLVRRPDGQWDDLYYVDNQGTRPIVVVNESENRLLVAYTSRESGGNILYRESRLDTIDFGPRRTLIAGRLNNVTSTKQNFTDEVVVLASSEDSARSVLFSFDPPPSNQPPTVHAGAGQVVAIANTATLNGTVTDDGLPLPPGSVSVTWAKVSGPGAVTFANPSSIDTTASFSTTGVYVLRLTAHDGELSAGSKVAVTVTDSPQEPTTVAFQDGVNGYQGTRDTNIKSYTPSTNYGAATSLEVDGRPDQAILLAWDIAAIPVGSEVTAATITLNITNGTSQNYEIHALQQPWNESETTWQQYAAGSPWSTAGTSDDADHGSTVLGQLSGTRTGTSTLELNAAGVRAVQAWVDNPSNNYGLIIKDYVNASNGVDLDSREHSNPSQRPKLEVTYTPSGGVINQPPTVDAGADKITDIEDAATLDGSVVDDGLPSASVSAAWTKVSGPGSVVFADALSIDTTASFSTTGVYVLRLTADDGEYTAADEVSVDVHSLTSDAGPDQTVSDSDGDGSEMVTLDASASSDSNGTITDYVWKEGDVTLGTTVQLIDQKFSVGTHTVTLTVTNDGGVTASDTTVITVAAAKNWIEAESGHLTAPMGKARDATASGGKYVMTTAGKAGSVQYTFNVGTTGDYAIWGRILAPTMKEDSFFVQVDDGAKALWDTTITSDWAWDRVSDRVAGKMTYSLLAGEHTLTIFTREDGTKLDKLLIANDLSYTPSGEGELGVVDAAGGADPTMAWLEAEHGNRTAPMTGGVDETASGGLFVASHTESSGSVQYTFTAESAGTYVVWGRVLAPTKTDDSFFVQIDDGEMVLWDTTISSDWTWDRVSDREAGDMAFNLEVGEHTLTIFTRENGTKLDNLLVTDDFGYLPTGRGEGSAQTWFEAESGSLTQPMAIGNDALASGGQYLWTENGLTGSVDYSFDVDSAGDYSLWGRVLAPNGTDDSFFVQIDGGEQVLWDTTIGTDWVWDQVSDRTAGDMVFSLDAGQHTLIISTREDGVKLDMLMITDDLELFAQTVGDEAVAIDALMSTNDFVF